MTDLREELLARTSQYCGKREASTLRRWCCIATLLSPVQLSLPQATAQHDPDASLVPIELTVADPDATGYATFQSHNQKVVANDRGYFLSHIRTRNEAYTAQKWRLSRSTDRGKTFQTIYEATHATNPPVLETDEADNIYLIRPDFTSGDAFLYRFLADEDYRRPHVSQIPNGAAGKFAMEFDPQRRLLYFFAHNNTFHRIQLDGTVQSTIELLSSGEKAALQYPLLFLDSTGVLHAAWTTQRHGVYLYWDIHYLQSPDGGVTWTTMTGQGVDLPVIADEGGPADRISLDDEFEVHTWLENFFVRDGKAHFLYQAHTVPPRQHYVRYDVATGTREIDQAPQGAKIELQNLDGFFATDANQPGGTIYAVSRDARRNRLAALASDDDGVSWRDHAIAPPVDNLYSIGGSRTIVDDGWIIGTFTERVSDPNDSNSQSRVQFFRFRAD